MPNSKSVVKALPSQMTVLANGNVGIGTTAPLQKLHIQSGYIKVNDWPWFYASSGFANGDVSFTGVIPYASTRAGSVGFTTGSDALFTAPIAGIYNFHATVLNIWASGTRDVTMYFALNGDTNESNSIGKCRKYFMSTQNTIQISATVQLSAGSTVRVYVVGIGLYNQADWANFSGHLVCGL